jgi:hypothetical protein
MQRPYEIGAGLGSDVSQDLDVSRVVGPRDEIQLVHFGPGLQYVLAGSLDADQVKRFWGGTEH